MIFLAGDFPTWLPLLLGLGVFGFTTALIIGSIIAGGLASAGTTAAVVKNAVEGHWPWDDFEAWSLDALKGGAGGLGSVISAAQGEPTIMGILAGEGGGTSREGGTGGVLPSATGQAAQQISAETRGQTPEQQAQGRGGRPSTPTLQALATGVNRYDTGQAGGLGRFGGVESEGPSRSDVFKDAAKSIGIGLAGQIGGVALGGLGGALLGPAAGTLAGEATSAAAPAVAGAAPAATGAAVPAVTGAAPGAAGAAIPTAVGAAPAAAPAAGAPSGLSSALDMARQIPSQIRNVASGIQQYTLGPVQSALESAIGETPTSILGQTAFGALKGAGFAAAQGDDPLKGAASGAAGGFVGGGLSAGLAPFMPTSDVSFGSASPQPSPFSLLGDRATPPSPFSLMNEPGPQFGMQMQPPSWSPASFAARPIPSMAGGLASSAVGQAMTPQPPMPPEPAYQHRTPYNEQVDIYGGLFGGNPYYRGM